MRRLLFLLIAGFSGCSPVEPKTWDARPGGAELIAIYDLDPSPITEPTARDWWPDRVELYTFHYGYPHTSTAVLAAVPKFCRSGHDAPFTERANRVRVYFPEGGDVSILLPQGYYRVRNTLDIELGYTLPDTSETFFVDTVGRLMLVEPVYQARCPDDLNLTAFTHDEFEVRSDGIFDHKTEILWSLDAPRVSSRLDLENACTAPWSLASIEEVLTLYDLNRSFYSDRGYLSAIHVAIDHDAELVLTSAYEEREPPGVCPDCTQPRPRETYRQVLDPMKALVLELNEADASTWDYSIVLCRQLGADPEPDDRAPVDGSGR